jgi:hypothetical protein
MELRRVGATNPQRPPSLGHRKEGITMIKIGTRVKTQFGEGTVQAQEPAGRSSSSDRVGILHDEYPANVPRMYKNDIMYFFTHEVSVVK